ncbi:alpha-amylase, partial [bacterium]|nr:alpha-amylase [bacterium]
MPSVVLNLHAHLPLRLKKYSFFDIGHSQDYFDGQESRRVLERRAMECYLPVNGSLLRLIRRHRGRFRVSCSVSGMLLEQLEEGQNAVLESFRRLADTGCVEFLSGPWHHSLASLFSEEELRAQIALHRRKI